ncbi:MAG: hypothetical protein HY231_23830 [Acidobacteria bacterium]|nr:hypothetical protein [Acidobacteriota bacterium]
MRPKAKVSTTDEDDDPADRLFAQIASQIMICKLAGVSQGDYEAWRDSMPDEYYTLLCEKVSEEDFQKVLIRIL